jgi:apolipoprotein N-acyltransferase
MPSISIAGPPNSLCYLKDLFLSFLSAIILILSFPNFHLGFTAWIGLLPLLIAIHHKSPSYGFLLSLVSGALFFLGIFYWIRGVQGYTLLHHGMLAIYLGLYFGLFGLVFNSVSKYWGTSPALFSAPLIWVSLEYIRSNLSFLGLPWALLAHSQYNYPIVIQITSLAGTYSISFLIVLVNAALVSVFSRRLKSPLPRKISLNLPLSRGVGKINKPLVFMTALLLISTLLYGHFVISQPITGKGIKVSLVQGNIEQEKKWDPAYARYIMQTYAELTDRASADHPFLIIWPETATPGSIGRIPGLANELKQIAVKAGTSILLGCAEDQKFEEKGSKTFKYVNSAYLIHPESKATRNQRYDKICLFPFGEYLPFREMIPWSLIGVSDIGDYAAGKELTVFDLFPLRFGVTICWENVFPGLVRQFVKRGAQVMINITNEARFGKTAAPHQLVSISVFRAVENKIFVVRCANTGVSCIIDPCGKIVDRVKDEKGQDLFVRGTITGWVIPLDSKTIYTRYGDWFVWVALMGSGMLLAVAFISKKK